MSDQAKCHVRERTEYLSHDRIIRLLQEVFSEVTESISWTEEGARGTSQPSLLNPTPAPPTLEGRAPGNPAELSKTHVGRLSQGSGSSPVHWGYQPPTTEFKHGRDNDALSCVERAGDRVATTSAEVTVITVPSTTSPPPSNPLVEVSSFSLSPPLDWWHRAGAGNTHVCSQLLCRRVLCWRHAGVEEAKEFSFFNNFLLEYSCFTMFY